MVNLSREQVYGWHPQKRHDSTKCKDDFTRDVHIFSKSKQSTVYGVNDKHLFRHIFSRSYQQIDCYEWRFAETFYISKLGLSVKLLSRKKCFPDDSSEEN